MEDLFQKAYTENELRVLESITPETADLNDLGRHGNVTFITTEADGIVTETLTFISFDNQISFKRVSSYPKANQDYVQLTKLNVAIKQAVDKEDYETAQALTVQKKQLLNGQA